MIDATIAGEEEASGPLFTLITITCNNLAGLEKTATSVLEQGFEQIDWIIIDGGSDDGTFSYLNTLPQYVRWLSEPDDGIYNAMNKGLEMVRQSDSYVLFLNAGDTLVDGQTLQSLAAFIQNQQMRPDYIYGDAMEETGDGTHESDLYLKKARSFKLARKGMFTHHQSMLYLAETIGDLRYDESYEISGDYDFTLRFFKKTPDIIYFDHPICIFESGGISQKSTDLGLREQAAIRKKHLTISRLENGIIKARQKFANGLKKISPKFFWFLRTRV